jgi:hypothetical protein
MKCLRSTHEFGWDLKATLPGEMEETTKLTRDVADKTGDEISSDDEHDEMVAAID